MNAPLLPPEPDALPAELRAAMVRVRLAVFDFDGVFTDNRVYVFEDGREAVACSRSDGFGLVRLQKTGVRVVVLSTEVNPVVSARCRKLQLECVQGCADKLPRLEQLAAAAGVSLAETAYVGNDINDAQCLAAVGLPVVVADAHPAVHALAAYRTTWAGGHGAVREICDLIAAVRERQAGPSG